MNTIQVYTFYLLYRLYKSLGEFDSLCGIFSSQIGTKAITSDALEAEERGDYQRAVQLYKEVRYGTCSKAVFSSPCSSKSFIEKFGNVPRDEDNKADSV